MSNLQILASVGGPTAIQSIFNWILAKYGEEFISTSAQSIRKGWKNFQAKNAARNYIEEIKKDYGTIKILDMTTPISLEGVYTDISVKTKLSSSLRRHNELLDRVLTQHEYFSSNSWMDNVQVDERRNGLEIINEFSKLLILGKPGAGKTTFLKHLALQAADGKIERLPIFVELRRFSNCEQSLIDFIVQQFKICNFPEAKPFIEKILETGKAIVLFDGLDEVREENDERKNVSLALEDFARQYDQNQFVITCRIAATDYAFEQFTNVEMADFDNEQIHTFVSHWYRNNLNKREEFFKEFDKNAPLQELARIPLLLTLLCFVFDELGRFSSSKASLYEKAIDVLLEKWDQNRHIDRDEIYQKFSININRKKQMFSQIAYTTFKKGEYFFSQRKLESWIVNYLQQLTPEKESEDINGERVLKAIEAQHGIFVENSQRTYSFAHLTFHEYFTAMYIVKNVNSAFLEPLFAEYIQNSSWREVFLLTASILSDADNGQREKFIKCFRTAIDRPIVDDPKLIEILEWAARKADAVVQPKYQAVAIRSYYLEAMFCNNLVSGDVLTRVLDHDLAQILGISYSNFDTLHLYADLMKAGLGVERYKAKCQVRSLMRILILDLALICSFDLVSTNILAFDFETVFENAVKLSQQMRSGKLYEALKTLSIPEYNASAKNWIFFLNQLRAIMIEHQDIGHNWELTQEQEKTLLQYLQNNELLIECLRLAKQSHIGPCARY